MPVRATKRGEERTALQRDCDVLVCGASFAGLAVARELAGSGANVLMIDRYEIGERQTSACAAPTPWLTNLGLDGAIRQTFGELVVHTPRKTIRYRLPWTFSTFDYRELCALLADQCDAEFETAKVDGIELGGPRGRRGRRDPIHTVRTDRGDLRAPLVVDALGWRRVLAPRSGVQPPGARLSRGLEVHPGGSGSDLEIWIDPRYVPAGYSWCFPARDELRVGVGSFRPRDHVKQPTLRLADDIGVDAVRFQGNWIPHQLRPATEDGVFFAGDSAGHCLPLTAEGIRTALYFGLACGRELRHVVEGRLTREQALERYAAFNAEHSWQFDSLLRAQRFIGAITRYRLLTTIVSAMDHQRLVDWSFGHYLAIAPPEFALRPAAPAGAGRRVERSPRAATQTVAGVGVAEP
jgi:flavin-dependent dehydrogenase